MTTGQARLKAAVAPLLALAVWSSGAIASVSLTNRDDKDHKLTIVEDAGAKTTEHNLKPMQVLEGICPKGCIVRIDDSEEDEYELEAGDKVSIEEGYLYYDEPENAQPGAGGAAAPAEPKKP
ncbi:MAG: hypothetical protein SFW09_04865 [Hyphomicrobiaceae bacterium]|nr:hypothetical protein [Hyphomicrobiaceae bacterium]